MSVTFVSIPAGTMTAASVLDNFTLLRTWMNGGVVVADVSADVIRSQHIFRPDSFGFPALAHHRATAVVETTRIRADDSMDIRAAVRRMDLFPAQAVFDNAVRMLPDMGTTFKYWGPTGKAVVTATWSAMACKAPNVPVFDSMYQGYFQIRYRKRETGAGAAVTNSRRQLQTRRSPNDARWHYSSQCVIDITAGTYDIWLEWLPDVANAEIGTLSVVCGQNSFMVQTHWA